MALAADAARYTPPKHISALVERNALLPAFWGEGENFIIAPENEFTSRRAEFLRREFGLRFSYGPRAQDVDSVGVWGWSRDIAGRLLGAGVSPKILPTEEKLAKIREISHRRTTLQFRRLIGEEVGMEIFDFEDAEKYLQEIDYEAFIKAPWSSSGRGVYHAKSFLNKKNQALKTLIEGTIRHQKSVIIEPAIQKVVLDFAILCSRSAEKGVKFEGLSIFETNDYGSYLGNKITSQQNIENRVLSVISDAELEKSVSEVKNFLENFPEYEGPVGVDFVADEKGRAHVVEFNFRRTMGFVAMDVWRRLGEEIPFDRIFRVSS